MENNSKLLETSSPNKASASNTTPNIEFFKKVYHWIGGGIRCSFFEETANYKGKTRKQFIIKTTKEFTHIGLHFNGKERFWVGVNQSTER